MRSMMVMALVCAGCISKGTEIPPLKAGPGVTVDPVTQQVSIDSKVVPQLPDCGPNQVVMKNAAGSWACATTAPNALLLAGKAADKYAAATAGVADSATDSAKLNGLTADNYAAATNGVANVAMALVGGVTPSELVQRNAAGDIPLGSSRATMSNSFCAGLPIIIGPIAPNAILQFCLAGQTLVTTTTSSSGVYCGATPAANPAFADTEPGAPAAGTTGYRAAKIKCERVTSCGTTAHMCRADEVLRSREVGINVPQGWYSTGMQTAGGVNDCLGWTDAPAAAANTGALWIGRPSFVGCASGSTNAYPILCCR